MAEASFILSPGRLGEFKSILGRLLVSLYRNEFYLNFSLNSLTLYVYEVEKHQARFCAILESTYFEEYKASSPFTVTIANLKLLFNTLSICSFKVYSS